MAVNLLILLCLIFSTGCSRWGSATPPWSTKPKIEIAFGSCIKSSDSQIWSSIVEKAPDLFVFLGDNVYLESAEFSSLEKIRRRYERIYSEPALLKLLKEVPHVATWSDHDFGPNNSDSTFEHKDLTHRVFKERWPTPKQEILPGSLVQQLEFDGLTLLLTDDRTFRINPGRPSQPQLFGEGQLRWIISQFKETKNPVVILASAGQILSTDSVAEGLYEYPKEESSLHRALATAKAHPIIISGDRHYAQIYKREVFGRKLTEVASSPLNAGLVPKEKIAFDPLRAGIYTETSNFGMVTIDFRMNEITTEIFNVAGEVVLSTSERI